MVKLVMVLGSVAYCMLASALPVASSAKQFFPST